VLALGACKGGPPTGATSVFLTIDNGAGLAVPDELRLTAYGDNGALFMDARLPESGTLQPLAPTGSPLGTVTVYVPSGIMQLRIDVHGYAAQVMQSQGTCRVVVAADKQVSARVLLQAATLPPDAGAPEGGVEGGPPPPDAGSDRGADTGSMDAPRTMDGPVDAAADAGAADAGGAEVGGADASDGANRCQGSSLVNVTEAPASPVDLTAEGTMDWRHWGLGGAVDYKASAGTYISDVTPVGTGTVTTKFRNMMSFSWTDGTPTATDTADADGMGVVGVGNGFTFTVPAAAAARTLSVYVTGDNDTGLFQASLSDGCVADFTQTHSNGRGQYAFVHRLTFNSAVPGTTLRVTFTMSQGFETIGLFAATLKEGP